MNEQMIGDSGRIEPRYDAEGNIIPLEDGSVLRQGFGQRAAQQTHAQMEDKRTSVSFNAREGQGSEADSSNEGEELQAPKLRDYRDELATMSFDERIRAAYECLNRRSSFRNILYGLLGFCAEEKTYDQIEEFCSAFSEFVVNRQEPRRYVFLLLRTGALEEIELDETGCPLTEQAKQQAIEDGLDPEDVDLLVYDWRIVTTDVGMQVYEDFSPAIRLAKLFSSLPEREEALFQILDYLREPRSMGAIDEAFKGKELLGIDKATHLLRQPSSYVQKLDGAGAIEWDGHMWKLTQAGVDYLSQRINE